MATTVVAPVQVVHPAILPATGNELEQGIQFGPYRARLATSEKDRLALYRLRFVVFNLELNEGSEAAFASGHDRDQFDEVCDHILVERVECGSVIGTYRLQSGERAARALGYYSEQEFEFAPYECLRSRTIELGRACIHRDHRSPEVLNLLWKAIARYAKDRQSRWLIGCCSLNSQDPAEGWSVYRGLTEYQVEPEFRTVPHAALRMAEVTVEGEPQRPPKLLRSYLALGAKICGEPAIDREFKTIDFLTLMDLERLHPRMAARLFG